MAQRSNLRNQLEAAIARFLVTRLASKPWPEAVRSARRAIDTFARRVPRYRQTALRNLDLAYPDLPSVDHERIIDGCFESLARLLASVAHFPGISKSNVSNWIQYDGYEHYEEVLKRGKGVLFATGHLGNWELSAFAHALMSAPMSVVVRPLDNPILDEMATRYRAMSGNWLLGRRDFLRPVVEALRNNEAVGILVDQNVTADRGVFVDFFGHKACVDAGLARLAARTGAAVIPGFAFWNESAQRHTLKFYPPVEITGDALADTQTVHSALEHAIREAPDQWLWIHRRWKTRPAGEPSIY